MPDVFDTPAVVIGGLTLLHSFLGTAIPIISVPPSRSDLVRYSRLYHPSAANVGVLRTGGDDRFLEQLVRIANQARCRPVLYYGDDRVLGFVARNRDSLERHFLLNLPPSPADPSTDRADTPTAPLTWAQRLKRVFEIDITLCPLCGGQLRVIADITDPDLIRKILDHVNSRAPPRLPPRRAEPHHTPPNLFAER